MANWRFNCLRTLRARFLLALALIGILPLGLVGLGMATLDRRALAEQSAQELTGLARGLAGQLEVYLDDLLSATRAIAALPAIVSLDPAQQEPFLKELFHHYPQLARLSTFDLSGARLASSHPGGAPSIAARQSFQTAARRGHQAWEVAAALSSGRASLLIHTPIRDANRRVGGVVGAVIDLENLSAVVGRVHVGGGGRVFVLDAQGRVLLHPERAVVQEQRDYSWIGVPTGGRPAGPATVRYQVAGEALVAGYAPVPNINWTVVVERPEREILAPARQSWHLAIAGLGTSASLALLTAVILARMLTRPVQVLATAAQALAAGDAGVPMSAIASKVDEIHTLVEAFTAMRQAVIRREEALRASEGRKSSILAGALDGIITIDDEGRIVEFNPAAEQVFGYSHETVVGQRMADLIIPPSIRDMHYEGLARYLATGESVILGQRLEMMAMRADSTEIPVELSVIRVGAEEPPLFTAFLRDISARKQAEETLRRQQETLYQSEKLAAMGALLAGVAHELNNPLAVVLGQAELMRRLAEGGPLATRAAGIGHAAERCARIVKNFLALARQHPPERQMVRLNPIVREAVELLAYPLRVDDVEVVCNLADDLPPLWADPNQLHQVVVNLLTNARDALHTVPPPRLLTLTTCLDAERQHVMLEVADTGPGIPPELQGRIFEPFFTTKPVGQGTGLGLPLCYGIIQEHGGALRVESAPGQGARFIIELPVEHPTQTPLEPQPLEILSHGPGKRILVVDDEPEVAEILADVLAIDGHQVDTAGNGAMALECLRAEAYDLILSDLRMPELDGPGLYREIERSHPALLQGMLFLTGDTLSPELQAFVEQTGARTVNKPFSVAEVRRVVRQVLEGLARGSGPVAKGDVLAATAEMPSVASVAVPQQTVLIADDEAEVRRIIAAYLQEQGLQVVEAENGIEALVRVEQVRPTAVVLDLMMPRLGGLAALEQIREIYPTTTVLVITGTTDAELHRQALARGAAAIFTKPVALPDLLAAVRGTRVPGQSSETSEPATAPSWAMRGAVAPVGKVLIMDEAPEIRTLLAEFLMRQGYEIHLAADGVSGLRILAEVAPDVVLLDMAMPRLGGIEALTAIHAIVPDAKVIMMSGGVSLELAQRTLAYGAFDCLTKPLDLPYLARSLETVLVMKRMGSA